MTRDGTNTGPAVADGGLFVGLISGTSADGIDAAVVRFGAHPELLFARTYPMPHALVAQVLHLSQAQATLSMDAVGELDTRLGQAFADTASALLRDGGIDAGAVRAIGSHGQTLRHRPVGDAPFTLQLGDANWIAERTGIDTVADFRRRDVAAGGHGAPLVPAFHAAVLTDPDEERAVLNVGGIANLTLLPRDGVVRGFDTGPANGLMDAWCLRHNGARYDAGGVLAASGAVHEPLLQRLLGEPWLALPPPKSTGRDQFQADWLDNHLQGLDVSIADVQATLCRFSARTIADALRREMPAVRRLLACGGGVHNPTLLHDLRAELPGVVLESTAAHGLDPDFVEAMAFAWLARETLARRPGNLAAVTGARGPRILGAIYPGGIFPGGIFPAADRA
ncbi:anhydro-N-acetylmuramic acid kinase [soil metagenome]